MGGRNDSTNTALDCRWAVVGAPLRGPHRRLVGLLLAGAIAVAVGGGAAASAVPAGGRGGPVRILLPRAGSVIVAGSSAGAHRVRLFATLAITRPVRGLGLRLNGHPIHLPARSGRLRVLLDAADGLVVGENLLWMTVGGRELYPTVPFEVGDRDARALSGHLRLGAGRHPAATASLQVPRTGIDRLSVTLNGVPLRTPPHPGTSGRLALDLAQLGTVRWGTNRVRVRLIMLDGRIDDWTRAFWLDPRRNIAVARLDGRAVVGHTAVLDASRSLIVPAARRAHEFRWVLLRRPRLSHARLGRARGVRIMLHPDVPGHYLIALVAGRRRGPAHTAADQQPLGVGYDLSDVVVTYPEPLVPLDTITYRNDLPGVQVGSGSDGFYADQIPARGQPLAPIQVLVLERDSLEMVSNQGQGNASNYAALQAFLAGLPSTDLVIITHPSGTGALNPAGLASLDGALRAIGGSLPTKWTLSKPHCWSGAATVPRSSPTTDDCGSATWQHAAYDAGVAGRSFTVIGVPGGEVGQAFRETAVQAGGQEGRIVGYLTEGTDQGGPSHDYTVINGGADQYEAVNTCAGPDCVVQIGYPGYADYATYPSPGPNGFQVLELDRTTLAPLLNRTVTTEADLLSALSYAGGQQQVGHFVGSMDDQRLVIIRSVGNGYVGGQSGGGPTSQAPLLQYIDELGGTPDLLLDTMTGHYKYALVGAATNLPWRNAAALESSTAIPGTPPPNPSAAGGPSAQTGQISGVLQRDRSGLFAPAAGDPASVTNPDLYRILYEPAQPWPYADDTADLKSIAYQLGLTNQAGSTGYPDIRSAYYLNLNGENWSSLEQNVKGVVCTADECGDDSTFGKLKKELEHEFNWVGQVKTFGDNLITPYEGANSLDIQTVYLDVKNSVPVPAAQKVKFDWLGLLDGITYLGSSLASLAGKEGLSGGLGLLGSAGTLGTWVMGTVTQPNGAPAPADTLTDTADNLTQVLYNQVVAYEKWVGQMQGILVYDYGKLSQVGPATTGDLAWAFGNDYRSKAVDALRGSTRASAYSALVPAVWPGYNLKVFNSGGNPNCCNNPPPYTTQDYSNDTAQLACDYGGTSPSGHQYPFANATKADQDWWVLPPPLRGQPPPTAQHQAITTQMPDGSAVDQAWVFGQLNSGNWADHGGGARTATLPTTDLTRYIYGADSTTGAHGAYQFAPVWWRDTYNPPSRAFCWRHPSNQSQNYYSVQYPPLNIPAPPP